MLLALKTPWSRRTAQAADGHEAADSGQRAAGGTTEQAGGEPLAEVIALSEARQALAGKRCGRQTGPEAGMATAEYAIATLAAVGFAGLLVLIMRSGEVRGLLMNIIEQALSAV